MAGHIGIVACSAEGAALCYRTINLFGASVMGEHMHPETSMHTYPLGTYMKYIRTGDWENVANLMIASAEKLALLGADFAVCPDNTIHQAFDMVIEKSPLPWLHIADVVAEEAQERGFKLLGVLGTRYLMEGPVYESHLADAGIKCMIPSETDRLRINDIIFKELVNGIVTDESRRIFIEIVAMLKEQGCDAVVMGCTEIPLIINDSVSPLPTLDSTRLLAKAAVKKATAKLPLAK